MLLVMKVQGNPNWRVFVLPRCLLYKGAKLMNSEPDTRNARALAIPELAKRL